jgi:hypothetical protein
MLGTMMARAAGWGKGNPVNRDDPRQRKIECKESGTPFRDEPDLRSVAVLYVTREEASAIADLVRELQAARASGADQFVVRKPYTCANGHRLNDPGQRCVKCAAAVKLFPPTTGVTGAIGVTSGYPNGVGATGYTGSGYREPTGYTGDRELSGLIEGARFQPGRMPSGWTIDFDAGNERYLLCDETRAVRAEVDRVLGTADDWMIVRLVDKQPPKPIGATGGGIGFLIEPSARFQPDQLPSGWAIDFDAGNERYLLCDETRSVRAQVARLIAGQWMVVRAVETAKPTEPTTAKLSGDAARFAGIDFND